MRRFARAHPDLLVVAGLSALGATLLLPLELSGRVPLALAVGLGALAEYDWARRLFGRAVGALAALVMLTAPRYLLCGERTAADACFVAAYAAGLGYLAVGLFTRRGVPAARRRSWSRGRAYLWREWPFVAFWALEGLATAAGGLVGTALVALVLAAYLALTFRWRDYAGRLAPLAHARRLLARAHAGWGLPLLAAVATPWLVHVRLSQGEPYWSGLVFSRHVGAAAGLAGERGTFEVLVRELAHGMFPWSAFLPVALWRFLGRASPTRSVAERRNALALLAVVVPFLYFALAGTKLADDVLALLPFAAVLVAATLVWLGRGGEPWVRLREPTPPLGPPVPPSVAEDVPWWQRPGAKGDLAIAAGITLVTLAVLARDLAADPGRPLLVVPLGLAVLLWLPARWIARWHLALVAAASIVLACRAGWMATPASPSAAPAPPRLVADAPEPRD